MPLDTEMIKRLEQANDLMRGAEEGINSAIASINSAAARQLQVLALAKGSEWRDFLIAQASSNPSHWSGGPYTATNIIEAARRNAALNLLRFPPPELQRLDTQTTTN